MMNVGKQELSQEKFWTFSLWFYSLDKNQQDLLRLQDEANLNVNHCLLLFYLFNAGYAITREQCRTLDDALLDSERVTEGLRIMRKQQSSDKNSQPYNEALQTEIASEKNQQAELIRCLHTFSSVNPVLTDTSEKEKIAYFQDCMIYLAQKRNSSVVDDTGQSDSDCLAVYSSKPIVQCINKSAARLVNSYLKAQTID